MSDPDRAVTIMLTVGALIVLLIVAATMLITCPQCGRDPVTLSPSASP